MTTVITGIAELVTNDPAHGDGPLGAVPMPRSSWTAAPSPGSDLRPARPPPTGGSTSAGGR